jgi:dTDP-L-rhamnose 4-epimerase
MKKILITGGAGFIGSNMALALLNRGYTVTVLDTLSEQIHGADYTLSPLYRSIEGKVNFIRGCVTVKENLVSAIADNDAIVHLAAETGTGQSMYEIDRYTKVNIGGTGLLLDLLTNTTHNVKKMVIASSRSIYGEGRYISKKYGFVYPGHRSSKTMDSGDFEVKNEKDPDDELTLTSTDEGSQIHPSSVYGITKQTQEQLVMTVCPAIGIAPVAFRYQNVYGPGQSLTNPYTGILSIFSNLILNNKPINIFEDGKESRDFVFIDDVVNATIAGLESNRGDGEVFNVGFGKPISVIEVVEELIANYGITVPYTVTGNYRLGDIRHNYANIEKLQQLLQYNPQWDFKTGIAKFCAWVKVQEIAESKYEQSLAEMRNKGLFK